LQQHARQTYEHQAKAEEKWKIRLHKSQIHGAYLRRNDLSLGRIGKGKGSAGRIFCLLMERKAVLPALRRGRPELFL
jgi:hypothetical protein